MIVVFLESWSEWTGSSSQVIYPSHRDWPSPPARPPPPASLCKAPPKSHVLSPRHELEQDWWILFGGIPDRSTWPGLSLEPQVQIPGDLRTSRALRKPKQWSESLRAGQGREGSPIRTMLHPSLGSSSGPVAVSNTCEPGWSQTSLQWPRVRGQNRVLFRLKDNNSTLQTNLGCCGA